MHVCLRLLFASQKCKTFAVLLVPAELSHRSLIFAPRGGFAVVSFLFIVSSSNPLTLFSPCTTPACRSVGENSLFRHFVPYGGSSPSRGPRRKYFRWGCFRRQKTPHLEVFFLALFGDMTPARFARFRRSRNDTADTALDAIGTPCNDRYSVTSFLSKVQPEKKGALPAAIYPFQISKKPQYLVLFLPPNFSGCQPFSRFDSQIQPISISRPFSALFPTFRTARFCLHLRVRTMTRNVLYQIHFYTHISSIPKLFRYS